MTLEQQISEHRAALQLVFRCPQHEIRIKLVDSGYKLCLSMPIEYLCIVDNYYTLEIDTLDIGDTYAHFTSYLH